MSRVVYPGAGRRMLAQASLATGFSVSDLTSRQQHQDLVRVRWAIMFVARELGLSFSRAAGLVGRSDHSTAMHGVKGADALIASDPLFAELVDSLRAAAQAPMAAAPSLPLMVVHLSRVPFGPPAPVHPAIADSRRARQMMAAGSARLASAIEAYRLQV